jgi:hypothetical protein
VPTADLTSVPQTAHDVSAIELDGEAVLYDGSRRRLIVLNCTASLIWSCCDGAATIDAMIIDIAAAYGVPREAIETDVLEVLSRFDAEALLLRGRDG